MIEIKNLRKEYPNVVPIADLSTTIQNGEVVSLIGPSGTGKSTVLRLVNMLERPTAGHIIVDGEDITAPNYPLHKVRGKIAMVFQSFNLFNHMTVIENVTYAPIKLHGKKPAEAYEYGMKLLEQVGMAQCALKYPDQLSGGQKQRAAIARTLAIDPEVILFDEPTSALDPTMVGEVEKVIQGLTTRGYTIMLVTHDMKFAEKVSTRVLYLDGGGVCEEGTPEEIFHNPQDERTRNFIKQFRSMDCRIDSKGSDFLEFYTMIDKFTFKHDIEPNVRKSIITLFEEVCYQIVLPKVDKKNFCVDFHLEYSARDKDATIIISTADCGFNPDDTNDEISWNIVKHVADSMEIGKNDEGTNTLTIHIK